MFKNDAGINSPPDFTFMNEYNTARVCVCNAV